MARSAASRRGDEKGGASALRCDHACANGGWTFANPGGSVGAERIYCGGGGAQALLTRNVKDAPGREVKHVEHLFRDFYWGHSAVKKVEGFGNAARETTWQYIEKGAARGKVMERAAPEGGVVRCACDAPEGVGLMKRARAPAGRRRRLTRPLILRNLFY